MFLTKDYKFTKISEKPEPVKIVTQPITPQKANPKRAMKKKNTATTMNLDVPGKAKNGIEEMRRLSIDVNIKVDNNVLMDIPDWKKTKRKKKVVEKLQENSSIKNEKRFLHEYDSLKEVDTGNPLSSNIEKLRYLFASNSLEFDDPRVSYIFEVVNELEKDGEDLDFKRFKDLIKPCYQFFRQILQNQLSIKDSQEFYKDTEELFEKVKNKE